MRYEDLKELGSEAAVKAAGKYNTKGKEYEVQVLSLSFPYPWPLLRNLRDAVFTRTPDIGFIFRRAALRLMGSGADG